MNWKNKVGEWLMKILSYLKVHLTLDRTNGSMKIFENKSEPKIKNKNGESEKSRTNKAYIYSF